MRDGRREAARLFLPLPGRRLFCPPTSGNGGVLFPCRKRTKSTLKGRCAPLENPLNYGGYCFALRRDLGRSVLNAFVGAPVFCGYPRVLSLLLTAAPLLNDAARPPPQNISTTGESHPASLHPIGSQIAPKERSIEYGTQTLRPASAHGSIGRSRDKGLVA